MGISLYILEPELMSTDTHLSTSWQVSLKEDFSELVFSSIEDSSNKLSIVFNGEIIQDGTYYARARIITAKIGPSMWTEIEPTVATDTNIMLNDIDIPSTINTPRLTTAFERNNHPSTFFTLNSDDYTVIGNSIHVATTWVIEDIFGRVLFLSEKDERNLDSLPITIPLKAGGVYVLKTAYHGSNQDVSPFGSLTININDRTGIVNLEHKSDISETGNYKILVDPVKEFNVVSAKFHFTSGLIEKTLPTGLVHEELNVPYGLSVIEITLTDQNNGKLKPVFYYVINNDGDVNISDYLPGNLPYALGTHS